MLSVQAFLPRGQGRTGFTHSPLRAAAVIVSLIILLVSREEPRHRTLATRWWDRSRHRRLFANGRQGYLHKLLIQGAHACIVHLDRAKDHLGLWISQMDAKGAHRNSVDVALANTSGCTPLLERMRITSGVSIVWGNWPAVRHRRRRDVMVERESLALLWAPQRGVVYRLCNGRAAKRAAPEVSYVLPSSTTSRRRRLTLRWTTARQSHAWPEYGRGQPASGATRKCSAPIRDLNWRLERLARWTYGIGLGQRANEESVHRVVQRAVSDECPNERWFTSVAHARAVISSWLRNYNEQRQHSALN